jgi:hypothetical protein
MTNYANKKRLKELTLGKEDRVYLFYKNIKTKRLNDKLDYKKIRPFKIKKKLLDINFKLLLPTKIQIYSVFYILLLELVLANI